VSDWLAYVRKVPLELLWLESGQKKSHPISNIMVTASMHDTTQSTFWGSVLVHSHIVFSPTVFACSCDLGTGSSSCYFLELCCVPTAAHRTPSWLLIATRVSRISNEGAIDHGTQPAAGSEQGDVVPAFEAKASIDVPSRQDAHTNSAPLSSIDVWFL
jgi:hypothetical protein